MATDTSPANQPLENVSGDVGETVVPKSRLATAEAARSMLSKLIEADIPASIDRTKIQRNIDGAPPFTQDELEAAGQANTANCNWGGARARIRDYLTAFHDIITSTQTLPNVKVTVGDIRQRSKWGQSISQRFHDLLFATYADWSFLYNMQLHHKQLAIHGVGPCFRRVRRDWRFHALKRRNILVPRDSPSDISRVPIIFVRDTMYVTELYKFIRGKKDRTKWNKDAALAAIKGAQIATSDRFNTEDAEQLWQDNAYDWSMNKSQVVKVGHAFVREFDDDGKEGGISHHIFTENGIEDYKPKGEDTGYLYSDVGGLSAVSDAVWVCFQDVGNGDFESVRGLGLEAHHWGEMQSRLNNGLANNAIEAGAVVWQADTPEHAEKMTRIEIGPNRLVPSGITQIPLNTGAGVQAQLSVSNHFSELEAAGTGTFRTKATTPSNNARTATEVEAEIGETSKLSNSSVANYLIQLDTLIEGTFKAATRPTMLPSDPGADAALEMKRLLIEEDGIPEEFYDEICKSAKVSVTRPIGNGSYADRIARLKNIGQFIGDMPDRKRKQFVRDNIAYIGGDRSLADAYGPDLEQDEPGLERSLAILENNGFMGGGQQDPFSPDNSHEVHFQAHIEFAQQMLGGDPQKAAGVMQFLAPHMAEHVQALENDPTRRAAFDQFEKQLGAMQNDIKRVNKMAQEAAEAAQQQQQPSPEMAAVQSDAQIKATATQADIARKDAKAKQSMAATDAKTAQHLKNTAAKAKQDREIAAQNAELEKAKALAKQESQNG